MSASIWEEFNPESFEDYLRAWSDPPFLAKLEITDADAAYHVLAYSGMVARRRGADACGLPASLAKTPPHERVRLVRSACAHMVSFSFHTYYHELFDRDELDLDELAEANELLMQRDEWDAALWIAGKLVDGQLETDEALLCDLALAHSVAAAFDEELFKHPDIVAGALYVLDDAPEIQRIGPWFQRAKERERQFNDPTLADVLAAARERTSIESALHRQQGPLRDISQQDRALPRAALSLAQWSKKLVTDTATVSMAASEPISGQVQPALKCAVLGDESVLVRFEISPADECTQELGIFLDGHPRDVWRYRRAEISFGEGTHCDLDIKGDAARLNVTHEAIAHLASLTLVETSGKRRKVDLHSAISDDHEQISVAQRPA